MKYKLSGSWVYIETYDNFHFSMLVLSAMMLNAEISGFVSVR